MADTQFAILPNLWAYRYRWGNIYFEAFFESTKDFCQIDTAYIDS